MPYQRQADYYNVEEMHRVVVSTNNVDEDARMAEASIRSKTIIHELLQKRCKLGLVCEVGALISLHGNGLVTLHATRYTLHARAHAHTHEHTHTHTHSSTVSP